MQLRAIYKAIYLIGVLNLFKHFTDKIPDFEYLLKNVVIAEYRGTFARTGLIVPIKIYQKIPDSACEEATN
jgi:hypothetical protein